jgi:hypothetical protein
MAQHMERRRPVPVKAGEPERLFYTRIKKRRAVAGGRLLLTGPRQAFLIYIRKIEFHNRLPTP